MALQKVTEIRQWNVLASFPMRSEKTILRRVYVANEARMQPRPGERVGGLQWRPAVTDGIRLDFLAAEPPVDQFCAGYACVYLYSSRAEKATFSFGSDDGLVVWLNGREVWRNDVPRGLTYDADVFAGNLRRGWNCLLCKVSQFTAAWELAGRVSSTQQLVTALEIPRRGAAEPSAVYGLRILPAPAGQLALGLRLYNPNAAALEGQAALRDAAGAVLACNAAALPACSCCELKLTGPFKSVAQALINNLAVVDINGQRAPLRASPRVQMDIARQVFQTEPACAELALLAEAYAPGAALNVQEFLAAWAAAQPLEESIAKLAASLRTGKPDLKSKHVHVVGHAHIDMNWLWTWPETVRSAHDTFRQVIAFMDEFPDFTFLQTQPAAYQAIERIDPPLFARIQQRVQEGRWELAGGMFTEGDTNMSGGEALVRTFLLGQRYFQSRFGKTTRVGWLPDNFGHVAQLPQVLRLAGLEYFFFHRCRPHLGAFWWEAPNGARVLAFSNHTYNDQVTPVLARQVGEIAPKTGRMLTVCGVGDHGGGPTRRDIEAAHKLDRTPLMPAIKFTRAETFFDALRDAPHKLPLHKGEMQYIFEGCYTSIARIKAGNRACEAALYAAELLSVLRHAAGEEYPATKLNRAWEIVAFNQFHDILCGSAIHESNQDSVADYKWALSRAEDIRDQALRRLADEVRVDPAKGQPFVAFNPAPQPRRMLIEAEVFTHTPPASSNLIMWFDYYGAHKVAPHPGMLPSVLLRDAAGQTYPAQVVWGKVFPPGYRWRVLFAADLPAGGYRTFYLDPNQAGEATPIAQPRPGEFETEQLIVRFDLQTGLITRLYDKRTRTELAPRAGGLNRLRIDLEKPHGMSAWDIGPIARSVPLNEADEVTLRERGPVRVCVESVRRWGKSKFIQRTYVYRGHPRIDVELEAHWFEQGSGTELSPMLRVEFPLAIDQPTFTCHTPFAAVTRPASGQEVPAQRWVDASNKRVGVALLNQSKYGHAMKERTLTLTLLRSSYDPDIYPDQGLHRIRYALLPHAGDFRRGQVWDEADAFNVPALATEPPSLALGNAHATRPEEDSLLSLQGAGLVLSGIKHAEEGSAVVVRFSETQGKPQPATLTLPFDIAAAQRLDLLERPLDAGAAPSVSGRTVTVAVHPHEIVTLGLTRA